MERIRVFGDYALYKSAFYLLAYYNASVYSFRSSCYRTSPCKTPTWAAASPMRPTRPARPCSTASLTVLVLVMEYSLPLTVLVLVTWPITWTQLSASWRRCSTMKLMTTMMPGIFHRHQLLILLIIAQRRPSTAFRYHDSPHNYTTSGPS